MSGILCCVVSRGTTILAKYAGLAGNLSQAELHTGSFFIAVWLTEKLYMYLVGSQCMQDN